MFHPRTASPPMTGTPSSSRHAYAQASIRSFLIPLTLRGGLAGNDVKGLIPARELLDLLETQGVNQTQDRPGRYPGRQHGGVDFTADHFASRLGEGVAKALDHRVLITFHINFDGAGSGHLLDRHELVSLRNFHYLLRMTSALLGNKTPAADDRARKERGLARPFPQSLAIPFYVPGLVQREVILQ